MSLTSRVFLALALGLALGILALAWPVAPLMAFVHVVEPIGSLWVNAIRMTVVPLVFSLLVTGVASQASSIAVGRVAMRSFLTFFGLLGLAAVTGLTVVPALFSWLHVDPATSDALRVAAGAGAEVSTKIPTFTDWLTGVVPTNPLKAAADGAMLPLVVFSLLFALALLKVEPDRREAVVGFFRGVGDAMLRIVRVIINLAPIGVFALMLPVASRTGVTAVGALGYYLVAMVLACVTLIVLLYPVAALVGGVSIARFARGVFPAQAVAVSTSSSLASLPALIDGADRRLELPPIAGRVVLPLAVSTFKIGSPVVWMVAAVFLSKFYGIPLAPTQYLMISLTALLTSFSVPGVPHGWLLVISPLLSGLGIPPAGIALLIGVDLIPDIVATTLNVTADMVAATIVSRGEPRAVSGA